jgi:hypothetical protein
VGAKKNSKGYKQHWIGYKLHVEVNNCCLPISAALTAASLHESRVALFAEPVAQADNLRRSKSIGIWQDYPGNGLSLIPRASTAPPWRTAARLGSEPSTGSSKGEMGQSGLKTASWPTTKTVIF